jgi:hypothetical protein
MTLSSSIAASRPRVPASSGEGICVPEMSACANATGLRHMAEDCAFPIEGPLWGGDPCRAKISGVTAEGAVEQENDAGGRPGLIGRRDLFAMVGGTAVAWPLAARAQGRTLPLIGFL